MAPNRKRGAQDNQKKSTGMSDSNVEQVLRLIDERDKAQAVAQDRLIQAQTDGARNMAEVASSLSKVVGAQQDTHTLLAALERSFVDHDLQLQTLIKNEETRVENATIASKNLGTLLTDGCQSCKSLQRDTTHSLETVLTANTAQLTAMNANIQKLIEKQAGLGKTLQATAGVGAALAAIIGLIITLILTLSNSSGG
jgi:hypothetical protein